MYLETWRGRGPRLWHVGFIRDSRFPISRYTLPWAPSLPLTPPPDNDTDATKEIQTMRCKNLLEHHGDTSCVRVALKRWWWWRRCSMRSRRRMRTAGCIQLMEAEAEFESEGREIMSINWTEPVVHGVVEDEVGIFTTCPNSQDVVGCRSFVALPGLSGLVGGT